jgi:polygalacturonase
VRHFGAKGDGKALDSAAINKAIDVAVAKGGGTVFFPAAHIAVFRSV